MVWTWPRMTILPAARKSGLIAPTSFVISAATLPRSRPSHIDVEFDRRARYCNAITMPTLRRLAFAPDCRAVAAMRPDWFRSTGSLQQVSMESILYCGDCTARLYTTPLDGLSQNEGVVWKLPERDSNTFCATLMALRPSCWMRVRSMIHLQA